MTNPKTVCPNCKIKRKSIPAKRCIRCHVEMGGHKLHSQNLDFRKRLRKRIKEIAIELGHSPDYLEKGVPEF